MANKNVTLTKAVNLRENLQSDIISLQNRIRTENSIPKSQKRNFDIKETLKEIESLREKMIRLKISIQKANLTIPEGEKECIQYYVFLLAEVKRAKDNLMALRCYEGPTPRSLIDSLENTKGDFLVECESSIKAKDKERMLGELTRQYYDILGKLTKLNNTVTIELPF